jgi:O-antigen ligase
MNQAFRNSQGVGELVENLTGRKMNADLLIFLVFCGLFFSLSLGTSPPAICGALGTAIWIFSGLFYRRRHSYLTQSWFRPVAALILITWAGLAYTRDMDLGLEYALKTHYWFYGLALASVSLSVLSSDILIKSFLSGLLVNTAAAAGQVLGYLSAGLEKTGAASGIRIFKYHNKFTGLSGYTTLPLLLVLGILMGSYYFGRTKDRRGKVLAALLMALFLFHLAILESRGGYLVFILMTPLIASNLIAFGRGKTFKILLASTLMACLIFASPVVRKRTGDLVKSLKYYTRENSSYAWGRKYAGQQDRFYMWHGAVRIFLEHPFRGVGTGGYLKIMKEREDPDWPSNPLAHPHNNFLHMAVSNGVPGVLALAWLFWVILRNGWTGRREPGGFFVLAGGLVMFIGGMTDTRILNAGSMTLLALVTGLQVSISKGPASEPGVPREAGVKAGDP